MTSWHSARTAIHAGLTCVMLWMAFVFAIPGETFATSVSFRLMAELGSEHAWAMAMCLTGMVGLVGLSTSSPTLSLISVLVLATMHGVVATCFAMSNPIGTGSGAYAVYAGLGYYMALRKAKDGLL